MIETGRARVIGVFDSGVGGLTVVRRIWEALPHEPVLFVADQVHVPYGGRPLAEVAGFARGISAALIKEAGARAVVMACNVSTATALETVSDAYPKVAVLGVIAPGAEAAIKDTFTGSIGILATHGTVNTGAYTRALKALDGETEGRGDGERGRVGESGGRGDGETGGRIRVTEVACPEFVPLIESEKTDSPEALDAANRYLAPILEAGADVVILGCTHYPFLLPCLRSAAPHIRFIDPAVQSVRELAKRLDCAHPASDNPLRPTHTLYTTGDPEVFTQQIAFFLPDSGQDLVVKKAEWREGRLLLNVGAPLAAPYQCPPLVTGRD